VPFYAPPVRSWSANETVFSFCLLCPRPPFGLQAIPPGFAHASAPFSRLRCRRFHCSSFECDQYLNLFPLSSHFCPFRYQALSVPTRIFTPACSCFCRAGVSGTADFFSQQVVLFFPLSFPSQLSLLLFFFGTIRIGMFVWRCFGSFFAAFIPFSV